MQFKKWMMLEFGKILRNTANIGWELDYVFFKLIFHFVKMI